MLKIHLTEKENQNKTGYGKKAIKRVITTCLLAVMIFTNIAVYVGAAPVLITAAKKTELQYDVITVSNDEMYKGYQILVNNKIEYRHIEETSRIVVNVKAKGTGDVKVSSHAIALESRTLAALEAMSRGLAEQTGCKDLRIHSGYRTYQTQFSSYENGIKSNGLKRTMRYTAFPGHSEHHTGLACDLSFVSSSGKVTDVANHAQRAWLWNNCDDYGFIWRYQGSKEPITMIAHEEWHFRYVGFPHAKAVEKLKFCFEEYIDFLRDYTFERKFLFVNDTGRIFARKPNQLPTTDGYLIYFVPAQEGDTTEIKIPKGDAYDNYEISGNNVDGFIITITLDTTAG